MLFSLKSLKSLNVDFKFAEFINQFSVIYMAL